MPSVANAASNRLVRSRVTWRLPKTLLNCHFRFEGRQFALHENTLLAQVVPQSGISRPLQDNWMARLLSLCNH